MRLCRRGWLSGWRVGDAAAAGAAAVVAGGSSLGYEDWFLVMVADYEAGLV